MMLWLAEIDAGRALGASAVSLGAALLGHGRPPMIQHIGVTVLALLAWAGIWTLGASILVSKLEARPDLLTHLPSPEATTLAMAVLSWALALGLAWRLRARGSAPWVGRKVVLAALALAWFAVAILPGLGQGGAWPDASLRLAVICVALCVFLPFAARL